MIVCKPRHADTANRAKIAVCDTANRAKTRSPAKGVGERLIALSSRAASRISAGISSSSTSKVRGDVVEIGRLACRCFPQVDTQDRVGQFADLRCLAAWPSLFSLFPRFASST